MIRKRDGIHLEVDGRTVVADARSASGDVTLVTHAHGDHARRNGGDPVVCSAPTAALVNARTGVDLDFQTHAPGITLLPAGHVAGSRAALIEGDRTYCYTGDVSTRDRAYLSGFTPPDADVLIVESTYGRPAYRFPDQATVERAIRDWVADHHTDPLCLTGYSLGRAQKIQRLVSAATNRRLVVHPAVAAVNAVIEDHFDVAFDAVSIEDVDPGPGDIVVTPGAGRRSGPVAAFLDRFDPVVAGFSGWAIDDSYRYRTGCDAAFVLTDHCDFDELIALVDAVDPNEVYTHHGFAEDFAAHLGTRGYDAVALKRNQHTLGEFG